MKRYKMKLTITLCSMLMTFSLFAQGPPGGQRGRGGSQDGKPQKEKPSALKIMKLLDANDDGQIDRDEASQDKRGKISEDFNQIDINGDGFIDLEELETSLNDKKPKKISAEKIMKLVDDNGDGTLNELEIAAKNKRQLLKEFDTIDINKDNELDLEELKAFYSKNKNKNKNKNKKKKRQRA